MRGKKRRLDMEFSPGRLMSCGVSGVLVASLFVTGALAEIQNNGNDNLLAYSAKNVETSDAYAESKRLDEDHYFA